MTNNFYENFLNDHREIIPDDIIPECIRLYTVAQAAGILQTSKANVYHFIRAGLLKSVKIGTTKIRHDAISEFLNNSESMDLSAVLKTCNLKTA
jgi:excisionase family DNA binding protein